MMIFIKKPYQGFLEFRSEKNYMKEIFVNIGQIRVMQKEGILTTVGLGSCVGVVLYDHRAKIGAMAHIFLPESKQRNDNSLPGKYADTAVPALITSAIAVGARRDNLTAKIAGGAHLFNNQSVSNLNVGSKNINAVINQLNRANISIIGKDVFGNRGRKMRLYIDTGVVIVTSSGKDSIEI